MCQVCVKSAQLSSLVLRTERYRRLTVRFLYSFLGQRDWKPPTKAQMKRAKRKSAIGKPPVVSESRHSKLEILRVLALSPLWGVVLNSDETNDETVDSNSGYTCQRTAVFLSQILLGTHISRAPSTCTARRMQKSSRSPIRDNNQP